MRQLILPLILFLTCVTTPVQGQINVEPFCLTCDTGNLPADVYIVLPDDIQGQLISGQFYRITGATEKAHVSFEEMYCFMESKAKEFVKIGGGAYFLLNQGNKFSLVELVRTDETNFEPFRIIAADKVVEAVPYLNIIIPRVNKDIFSTQR